MNGTPSLTNSLRARQEGQEVGARDDRHQPDGGLTPHEGPEDEAEDARGRPVEHRSPHDPPTRSCRVKYPAQVSAAPWAPLSSTIAL
jgi:hypothetical protein